MRTRLALTASLLAAMLVLTAAPAAWADRPADVLASQQGVLFGAHVQDAATVQTFEGLIGRRLAVDHYYHPWADQFPNGREQWDFDNGRIPMISWGKADTAEITSGADDALIRTRAAAVAALGRPLFIRWFWEMDGHDNGEGPKFSVAPEAYIAGWRHIHDLFDAAGATNVAWVWCPNAFNFATGHAQQYYPGDDAVDWVCADGYDWYPAVAGASDRSFASVFQPFYDWGVAQAKPLMVGEFGALESGTDHKANWLNDAHTALETSFRKIGAVVYFNHDGLDPTAGIDWRVETSDSAVQAFTAMGQDPYFGAAANPASDTAAPALAAIPASDTAAPALAADADPPPDVPEAPLAVALPVSALLVMAVLVRAGRRRRAFEAFTPGPYSRH